MPPRSQAGQASAEYVALLAVAVLVALAAAAATAVAAPGVPGAIVHQLRLGLCLVGADVCRDADARARGLEPCVRSSEEHVRERTASILFVEAGGEQRWSIERRSDGTIRVSAADGQSIGATAGAGFQLGAAIRAGVDGSAGVSFLAGKAWELPDEAALTALLAGVGDRFRLGTKLMELARAVPEPDVRYERLRGGLDGSAGLDLGDADRATRVLEQTAGARAALGRRRGPDGTTLYFEGDAELGGVLAELIPSLGPARRVLLELRAGRPRVLVVRTTAASGDTAVETEARLPLTEEADRSLAGTILQLARPGRAAVRELAARIRARGTVERRTYRERTDVDGWNASLRLGAELGAASTTTATERELVSAEVVLDGRSAERRDCTGL